MKRREVWGKVLAVLKSSSRHRGSDPASVLTPLDLERRFDLPNSHVHHGESARINSSATTRPITPITAARWSFVQASASVHPGGGVTGVPGHNAAMVILEDRRKWS
jgi:phytoene dehydrogenase-like protein